MQGGADADHACPQYDNVGLKFRHLALRKFECCVLALAARSEASHCGIDTQTSLALREIALARRPNSGNMDRSWLSIVQK
jgi:hypothetical protein